MLDMLDMLDMLGVGPHGVVKVITVREILPTIRYFRLTGKATLDE